jgi:hypothetical protein
MYNELDSEKVSAGHVVQYGEGHHEAAVVLVRDVWVKDEIRKFELRVLDPIFGPFERGHVFEVGTRTDDKYSHYQSWQFKLPGEMTEYLVGDLDEQRDKLSEIQQRWRSQKLFARHELKYIEIPDAESS